KLPWFTSIHATATKVFHAATLVSDCTSQPGDCEMTGFVVPPVLVVVVVLVVVTLVVTVTVLVVTLVVTGLVTVLVSTVEPPWPPAPPLPAGVPSFRNVRAPHADTVAIPRTRSGEAREERIAPFIRVSASPR